MNRTALAFGIGFPLLLTAGPAAADCLAEVQSLEKQIVSSHKTASPGFGSEATTGLSGSTGEATAGADSTAPASDPVLNPAPGSDIDVTTVTSKEAVNPVLDPAPGTDAAESAAADSATSGDAGATTVPDSTTGPIEPETRSTPRRRWSRSKKRRTSPPPATRLRASRSSTRPSSSSARSSPRPESCAGAAADRGPALVEIGAR